MTFGRGEICLASDQLSSLEMRRHDSQDGQLSDKGTSASGEVVIGCGAELHGVDVIDSKSTVDLIPSRSNSAYEART